MSSQAGDPAPFEPSQRYGYAEQQAPSRSMPAPQHPPAPSMPLAQQWSPDGRWLWNGSQWQPVDDAYAPRSFGRPPEGFAWALAAMPLLGIVYQAFAAYVWSPNLFVLLACGCAILATVVALVVADVHAIRAAGVPLPAGVSVVSSLLLLPSYLFFRSSRLRDNFAIPIACCAAILASVACGLVLPSVDDASSGAVIDFAAVEGTIAADIESETDVVVAVECPPSVSPRAGETFQCLATTEGARTVIIDVTVKNEDGDITWSARDPITSAPSDQIETTPSAAPPVRPTEGARPTGPLAPVEVTSSSSAPDSIDGSGNSVTFRPQNAFDGLLDTAWRAAEGDGVGEWLAIDLGAAHTITRVGLVPGYDKVDPSTGVNRFFQNHRIERVRWVFEDGTTIEQTFSDDPSLQTINVSTTTRTIGVLIEATRPAGTSDPRNFAPISEVLVEGSR